MNRCSVSNYLIPWDKLDFGPRIGLAYHVADKMVIRLGYGIFYGGEENQGGSPNRGEGVPFNETVTMSAAQGISSFIGISEPQCTGCQFVPSGLVRRDADESVRVKCRHQAAGSPAGLPQSAGA